MFFLLEKNCLHPNSFEQTSLEIKLQQMVLEGLFPKQELQPHRLEAVKIELHGVLWYKTMMSSKI